MNDLHEVDTAELIEPLSKGRQPPPNFSALVQVDLGGLSHPGKVRTNNEDHFYICRFGRLLETLSSNLPARVVPPPAEEIGYGLAVADGIGGGAAGEVASRLAINAIVNLALHTPDWILRLDEERLADEVIRRAKERYEEVNRALTQQAADDPKLRGFGTTMTMAWSIGKDLFVAHLGDSRAYLLRQGKLRRLTHDDTLAQEMADEGLICQPEVASHRLRHVLTQALGDLYDNIRPQVRRLTLEDRDTLLLCTDGLTDMADEAAIAEILIGTESAEKACARLVDRALEAGGTDNVTVAVARYRLPAP
jgi:protein phosphatase